MKNKSFVLAITGPAGSGKSTVALKLAKQIKNSVNIDTDQIKHCIVNGFKYDGTSAGIKQWKVLGDNIGLLACNFQKHNYNIIINGCMEEVSWLQIQKHIKFTHKILLLPQLNTTINRYAKRLKAVFMGKKAVAEHHRNFTKNKFYNDFITIDSTKHSVIKTVKEILKILK